MKILIDNGHGVETPGKRSPDGRLKEYAYTREIANRVVDNCPTVLIENFFQDNEEDVKFLLSEKGKQCVTDIITEGIVKYINSNCL